MPFHLLPADRSEAAMNRRTFLAGAGLALGGAAILGTRNGEGADAPNAEDWYAWVSDTHIAADADTRSRGENMADHLRTVVAEILAEPSAPRGVFIDGDLALKDGQAGDYRTFLRLLEPLRKAKLPLHLALGNHDDRDSFRAVLRDRDIAPAETRVVDREVSVVEGPGLRFVVLDSLVEPNSTPGRLGGTQLDWLSRELDSHSETVTILFVHHNPTIEQKSGLLDTEALLAVVRSRRQVKALVFGHTHVWDISSKGPDVPTLINLPAVAYPFAATQPLGWCKFLPEPGGATVELRVIGGNLEVGHRRPRLRWRDA